MSGRILPSITRVNNVEPLYDPYGNDAGDVNIICSTITGTTASFSNMTANLGNLSTLNGISNVLAMNANVLNMNVSTITNPSANFIQFQENLIVRPPIGSAVSVPGSISLFNNVGASNANQYTMAVNGDGTAGGQFTMTRFQGGSSFPVFNIDNDGNMLFQDPGARVYADNLSTIALQAGSIVVPGQGRTLISTGSPVPSASLNSGATIANVNFGGSIGQFIPVTVGAVYCLQGSIAVTASAGLTTPFTVNVVSTDGVSPGTNYPVYSGITTAPYATGTGSMATVYVPITTTLKADFNKISVSASCPGLTGGQTLVVDMGAVTLVRIV